MIALIPLEQAQDEQYKHSPEGRILIRNLLGEIISSARFDRVIAASSDESNLRALASNEVDCLLLPGGEVSRSPELPLGTLSALGALDIKGDEGVAVIDFRNLGVLADTIEEMVSAYAANEKKPVVSVVAPEDHPCQLFAPYDVVGFGRLVLFDEGGEALLAQSPLQEPDVLLSKPFRFDWAKRGVTEAEKGSLWHRVMSGKTCTYESLPVEAGTIPVDTVWMFIAPDQASCIVRRPRKSLGSFEYVSTPGDACGVNIPMGHGGEALAFGGGGEHEYVLSFVLPDSLGAGCRVRVVPDGPDGPMLEESVDVMVSGEGSHVSLRVAAKDVSGFMYSILVPTNGPEFDLSLPYQSDRKLWRYGAVNGACFACATDEEIVGRQQFPEVLSFDGSVIVCQAKDLPLLGKKLAEGQCNYHLLPQGQRCKADSWLAFQRNISVMLRDEQRVAVNG